ncbi:response regulator transcription factor [Ornithinimicrobium sp. INDO-MA30-4]|uniref:response regulator n=1 Tax=Ornithinimicrobium sp. INDO-MA30-4 TaxID=2908651 RepID=UPI001F1BF53F|nr:response regulator transcription factor [Ornithinimicrobium sp. INDO-MA30-4]UJH69366.1 response regulator transcription factor [Ornithinimicrobium sp. INDO-MA30-4]
MEPADPGAHPIRIYLLDDHELVRRGLRDLLSVEPDMEIVGESGSAVRALAQIPSLRPDVAVLDARLPDGSGIEVCRDVRAQAPDVNALILTSYDDHDAHFASIIAGASGFVLKQISGSGLVDSIRLVASGKSLLEPAESARVLDRMQHGDPERNQFNVLSPQEKRVLELIAEGLTNRQIGDRLHLAEKTIKNYVSSILAKLGLERRTQAAVLSTRFQEH